MMAGGLTEAKPATPEVQHIVNEVKPQFESRENRTCDIFKAIIYKTQVVAGLNYFIKALMLIPTSAKMRQVVCSGTDEFAVILQTRDPGFEVQVSDADYVHLRVFQSLPHENQGPSLVSFQTGKTRDDPLTYF